MFSFLSAGRFERGVAAAPSVVPSRSTAMEAAADAQDSSRDAGMVLDALGAMLQLYGNHAFDTDARGSDEFRRQVRAWMLHATMGAPRPDHADDRPTAGIFYRDWKSVIQFFGEARRDEQKFVVRSLDDMRSVIWSFVSAVHQVVVEGSDESRVAAEQLSRMRLAVASNSTNLIKQEAIGVVSVMEQLLETRKERQQAQFARLAHKLKSLGRELEDAKRESIVDPLTGLANRKAFDEYITRCIELHSLLGQPASLMMIDVDNFKDVNDGFGHPAGDIALRQIANLLARTFMRRVDFVCRYGGDEFAVILQETGLENAQLLAERLRRQAQELRPVEPPEGVDPPSMTLSIGVAELLVGDDAVAWIKRADTALYIAKRTGRDAVSTAAF
ncbi:MAG: GGDEF domain-containing protein [Gemmatimonadaceae bacterium]